LLNAVMREHAYCFYGPGRSIFTLGLLKASGCRQSVATTMRQVLADSRFRMRQNGLAGCNEFR
jgi:hypothetical protein